MPFLYNLLLIFCIFCYTNSRPLQKDEIESGINDLESEDDIEIAADEFNDDKSKAFLKQEQADQEDFDQNQGILSENSYQEESNVDNESSPDNDANLISDYKPVDKSDSNPEKYSEVLNYNEKMGLRSNHPKSNRYTENNDLNQQLEPVEHFINRHVKICNANRMRKPQNKRTIHAFVDDSNKNNNQIINNQKDKDFERRNIFRHYDNENTRVDSENERNILNRDRRNVQEKKQDSEEQSNNNEYLPNSDSVNEELAIKKHIKRLSDTELEELLNSLTEEKRTLLKKIIDDDNNVNDAVPEGISKREITKKAGAVEDNNLIEGVQSDASKLQSSIPSIDISTEASVSHNTDTTTLTTKQTESSEKIDESTKKSFETNSESENKSDLTSGSYEVNQMLDNNLDSDVSSKDARNNAEVVNNQEMAVKSESKRETSLNNMDNIDTSLDNLKLSENDYYNNKNEHVMSLSEEYNICPQYENIAQTNDDEFQSHNEKSSKREITEKENETFDSIKALEESFPNSKTIGVTSSNTGPLIRVKRTDISKHNMTKRLAEIMPESKIGYYPHKTENVDEDYEEGSEFDNDIFYDRTSNIKSEKTHDTNIASNNNFKPEQAIDANRNLISDSLNTGSINESNEKETMELGSDNDSVLSGVEGVDENLMFSSNLQNKRNLDVNYNNIENT